MLKVGCHQRGFRSSAQRKVRMEKSFGEGVFLKRRNLYLHIHVTTRIAVNIYMRLRHGMYSAGNSLQIKILQNPRDTRV